MSHREPRSFRRRPLLHVTARPRPTSRTTQEDT
ncbi:hypothetical protein Ae263Ps1_0721 [Pseudonocardia sp. Ae263_Ps1]|nr:hypothetical protein Ae150APs1_4597c [Pseudonocardia sp. Ae150A_Ps1]OLL83666.1 hypothetical protein Ae263Ps1_0721 [Pseudonocardia sp. Ae263_Ps1]OLL90293.1 hypothetical protein Ae356Ps1_0190c [Pseudonocardia sp. Ae356_Ps1]